MSTIPYTLSEKTITFFFKGRPRTIASDHRNFKEIVEAVVKGAADAVDSLINVKQVLVVATLGAIEIDENDDVRFKNEVVPAYLATRILQHYESNLELVQPLIAFAEKLMANPNRPVREDLYKWLENGKMPIYEDGDFMAYKLVRHDYTPIHRGGTMNAPQAPGKVIEMDRAHCNENRDVTCSTGLHFCSYSYLPQFGSWNSSDDTANRVIVLKINPADVVAIPIDYSLTKGRTCRFEVVDEINADTIAEDFGAKLVVSKKDIKEKAIKREKARPTLEEMLAAVAEHGSKTKAAESLGIHRKTFSKWLQQAANAEGADLV